MLAKFFASWLVVLVLVPFTAPFSTCDLTGLFGIAQAHHSLLASPAVRERRNPDEDVTNDAAILSVPCLSTAGRIRLLPLSRVTLAEAAIPSAPAAMMWSAASTRSVGSTALSTILRV
jgi:hypothetical protein